MNRRRPARVKSRKGRIAAFLEEFSRARDMPALFAKANAEALKSEIRR